MSNIIKNTVYNYLETGAAHHDRVVKEPEKRNSSKNQHRQGQTALDPNTILQNVTDHIDR